MHCYSVALLLPLGDPPCGLDKPVGTNRLRRKPEFVRSEAAKDVGTFQAGLSYSLPGIDYRQTLDSGATVKYLKLFDLTCSAY